jgi:MATE family multidrug resistance protein
MKRSPTQAEFLALAIPNMLAGLAIPVVMIVDLAYLGHLEDVTPLSGVVLATVIFDFAFWSFAFLRIGTTGLVAQAEGRNDRTEQEAIFWRAMLMAIVIGGALTLLQTPIKLLSFALLTGEGAVEEAGKEYFDAHIWGAIPIMFNLSIIGWLLGQGRAGMVLILNTIWQLCNIVLNYIFIIELQWGAFGAGLGTTLSEWISMIAAFIMVYIHWGGIPKRVTSDILKWAPFKQLLSLNSAIMLRTFILMAALAAFTNISATFGEVQLAANALMMKLFIFYAFVVDGFAVALETLGGRSEGRKNYQELSRAFSLSMSWSLGSAVLFALLYWFAGEHILGLLTTHDNVIEAATPYIPWISGVLIIGGAAFVYDGFFYGLARPKLLFHSMIFAILAYAPFAAYAWQIKSTEWLWIAFVVLTFTRALTLYFPARKILAAQ